MISCMSHFNLFSFVAILCVTVISMIVACGLWNASLRLSNWVAQPWRILSVCTLGEIIGAVLGFALQCKVVSHVPYLPVVNLPILNLFVFWALANFSSHIKKCWSIASATVLVVAIISCSAFFPEIARWATSATLILICAVIAYMWSIIACTSPSLNFNDMSTRTRIAANICFWALLIISALLLSRWADIALR